MNSHVLCVMHLPFVHCSLILILLNFSFGFCLTYLALVSELFLLSAFYSELYP